MTKKARRQNGRYFDIKPQRDIFYKIIRYSRGNLKIVEARGLG